MNRRLGAAEVLALMGISRSAWYKGIRQKKYPAPIKDGARSTWVASQIDELVTTGTFTPPPNHRRVRGSVHPLRSPHSLEP